MKHQFRFSPLLRSAVAVLIAASAFAGTEASADAESALSGVWRVEKPVTAVRTVDGKEPPLSPEAAKIYQAHMAQRKQGDTSYDSATWCAAAGMPRIMMINSPFELVVRPPYVAFLHEWNWWARVVYLDGAVPETPKVGAMTPPPRPPTDGLPPGSAPGGGPGAAAERANFSEATGPMGLSVGKLAGDTLIIETSALRDSTLIDSSGLPHSDALEITETLRLRSPDVLENRLRIDDPKTFTQPWETVVTYRRQNVDIREDVCLDRIKTGQSAVPPN